VAENRDERLDRELIELLQELRVAIPGVQVMFAFLLMVPFTERFGQVDALERAVYLGAFLATAVASVLFIAPTAYHRLRWREYDKERMLVTSNRLTIAGTIFLALAVAGVVFVVTDQVLGARAAAATVGVAVALLVWFWFGLPLSRKRSDRA